jgi:hypothetical protein
MARVLGWTRERFSSWKRKGGGSALRAHLEREYGALYGKADPYSYPKTLKERRRESQERLALQKEQQTSLGQNGEKASG